MSEFFTKLKKYKFVEGLTDVLSYKFFPLISAAVILFCYYLGLDVVAFYYLVLTGIAMLLLLDDLTPLITHFLFLNIFISFQHSPLDPAQGGAGSDYFFQPAILAQMGILGVLLIAALFIRLLSRNNKREFRANPVFFGLCALSVAFFLNGAGSSDYQIMDWLYGFALVFCFLVIYLLIAANVEICEENYLKIGWGFFAFSLVLAIELAMKYVTNFDRILVNGVLNKTAIVMGWGVWNSIGTFFCICIPPVFLLAHKYKQGWIFTIYAAFLVGCAFMTGSRQAMAGSLFAFLICAVAVCIKSRARIANAVILGCLVVAAATVIGIKWDKVSEIFKKIKDGLFDADGSFSGNGRVKLLKNAWEYFKKYPIFGGGFFVQFDRFGLGDLDKFMPTYAHNTFAEILGTCGIVGIVAYLFHRVTTVIAFFKKPTFNKFFAAATILTLLVICLVDNYIFYLLPTLIYSALLPFATGNEPTKKKKDPKVSLK